MISTMIMLLVVLSGSFLGAALKYEKPAKVVPVTLMVIVATLYCFGLFGALKQGFVFVNVLVLLVYVVFIFSVGKQFVTKNERTMSLQRYASILAVVLFFSLFVVADRGMRVHSWDEFSHWADVVKVMVNLDDFATNPLSDSIFKSYPPAMALLQYYFQKINISVQDGNSFVDWRLYLTYVIFCASFLFPLFDDEKMNLFNKISTCCVIIFGITWFGSIYSSLYIDPFAAIVGGSSLSTVVFRREKDLVYHLHIFLSCLLLVLLKDVGVFFAIITAIAYSIDILRCNRKKAYLGAIPFILILFAKITWNYNVASNGATAAFAGKIDVVEYLRILVFRDIGGYKKEIADLAFDAFFSQGIKLIGIKVSYACLLIGALLALLFLYKYINKLEFVIIPIVSTAIYALFIGAIYIYRFSEYEARKLASYERYMNIVFLFLIIYVLVAISFALSDNNKTYVMAIFCYLVLVSSNVSVVQAFVSRQDVVKSMEAWNDYELIIKTIENNCSKDSKVYFLCRGDEGLDRLMVRYAVRPISVANSKWSLGKPYYEKDVWSTDISAQDWMDELIDEQYDFVAFRFVGKDFYDSYGELFEDSSLLADDSIFRVDAENRKLVACK